jgi:hypothetical protein
MESGEREYRGAFTEWFDEGGFLVEREGKVEREEKEALGDIGQVDGGVEMPAKAAGKKGRKKG